MKKYDIYVAYVKQDSSRGTTILRGRFNWPLTMTDLIKVLLLTREQIEDSEALVTNTIPIVHKRRQYSRKSTT